MVIIMKKNYILALFLTFVIIVATYIISKDDISNIVKVKQTFESKECNMKQVDLEKDKYVVKEYLPVTDNKKLNDELTKNYEKIVTDFKNRVEPLKLSGDGKKFSLEISFVQYSYNNYESFLIMYSSDFGGAHPEKDIITLNYDKKSNNIINIESLISQNSNTLEILSKCCYEELNKNNELSKDQITLKNGTSAKKENFEKFIFSNDGIILFFPSYHIDDFQVKINYEKLNILEEK